jgi:hypothetical protein
VFALFGLATCGGSAVSYTTACSPGRSVACVGTGACTATRSARATAAASDRVPADFRLWMVAGGWTQDKMQSRMSRIAPMEVSAMGA